MARISLVNIEKSFGIHKVISNLNLEVEDGQFVVLVGPSGCGKTTTLNMIAGLESITGGRLLIGDQNVTHLPPKRSQYRDGFSIVCPFPALKRARERGLWHEDPAYPKEQIAKEVAQVTERFGSSNIWIGSRKHCPADNARELPWPGPWFAARGSF